MKPSIVMQFLQSIISNPKMPAVFLWGAPGVGKSSVCRQVAKKAGIGFIDIRLALMDPTDLRGIPVPEKGQARWLPPSMLPTEGKGILLLDEFNLAPPLIQSSAFQLVLDGRIGEYVLPEGWHVVSAGNAAHHGAHVYNMSAPLKNRFIHVDFELDLDDWRTWAVQHGVDARVLEFISFRPELLFKFDPKQKANAFPTPRTWEFVSSALGCLDDAEVPEDITDEILEGAIGVGTATEFRAYLSMKKELPSLQKILDGKDLIPERIDVTAALVTGLAMSAKPEQFNRLLEYSENLPPETAVLMGKLLIARDKAIVIKCPKWVEWSSKYHDFIV